MIDAAGGREKVIDPKRENPGDPGRAADGGRRLRIALVVHDYNRHGGHDRYTAELAARLRRDHEVHVYANTFDEPDPAGITYHHIPAWRASALTSILSFVVPATVLVGRGYDVVHAQGLCGLRHDLATAHFCLAAWHAALADRAGGRLSWRHRIAKWLVTPLERRALCRPRTRRVIAISERNREDLARFYGRTAGVPVIYHGIDLEAFHPRNRAELRAAVRAELGVPDDAPLALFVGNLQKGAAAAIKAVARVPGVWLALVSGSDARADRAVAAAEGVAGRTVFAPRSRQVARYFAAADLFVFPTVYEPFGLVITEAMASGLPVVTARTAGAAELLTHGESGWLTDEPWDVATIADGVRALAADPGLRARMGAAARAVAEAYTWDRTAEETVAVYRQVVAGRGKRP